MKRKPEEPVTWTSESVYPEDDGIYLEVSEELYHGDRYRMSKHQLDDIERSPAHFKAWRNKSKEPSPAMIFGSRLDMLMTQPRLFFQEYAEGPDVPKSDKRWKAFVAALSGQKKGIRGSEWQRLIQARDSLHAHETAGLLFRDRDVIFGVSLNWTWRDGDVFVRMRSRPDLWLPKKRLLVDLKVTADARAEAFGRTAANLRYHVQAATYLTAMRELGFPGMDFYFACVEPEEPFAVGVWIPDEEDLELGFEQMRDDLSLYHACRQRDEWPAYSPMPQILKLPGYYRSKNRREFVK